jgi:UDP-sulfoquinovose synthase
MTMRTLVLGGDGYLGWPTAMHFSRLGHEVAIIDNLAKRTWESEFRAVPLWPVPSLQERARRWKQAAGREIACFTVDVAAAYEGLAGVFERVRPDTIIHYAEQPSAPYSMASRHHAVYTQQNNIAGTLNVLFAMKQHAPDAHLVKLGTMGEYGTPNIDIEEGWIEIEHRGRKDRVLYPKRPGSFYHLSKVHDSHNVEFACRVWGLRATDLNQGVVYGIETDETEMHPELRTSFHYDEVFGTALNRFCVQAAAGIPLTVYGKGGQKRGFLNIRDTLQCVRLAAENPARSGEFRVFNQFTEVFSVLDLARTVKDAGEALAIDVQVKNVVNPRVEHEEHYYNPRNDALLSLGLKPRYLSDELVRSMLRKARDARDDIDSSVIHPRILWGKG